MSAPDDARARDDAADAYDVLVRRVWEAVTGDTHEGPASVDVLLEAVAGLRARADRAEDVAHMLSVRVVQAADESELAAVNATPESAIEAVVTLRDRLALLPSAPLCRGDGRDEERRAAWVAAGRPHWPDPALDILDRVDAVASMQARAEKAEAARDALRAATQEHLDATKARIFAAVRAERERQDAKYGTGDYADVDPTLTERGPVLCPPKRVALELGIPPAGVARENNKSRHGTQLPDTWAHILVEEVAELVEAATLAQQGRGPDADVDSELVQVAAVCVSWLEARARRRALAGEG